MFPKTDKNSITSINFTFILYILLQCDYESQDTQSQLLYILFMGKARYTKVDLKRKPEIQSKFGQRIASIRTSKKITQENLSFDLNVDRTYISYIERGLRNPSLFMLWKISKALKTKLTLLVENLD